MKKYIKRQSGNFKAGQSREQVQTTRAKGATDTAAEAKKRRAAVKNKLKELEKEPTLLVDKKMKELGDMPASPPKPKQRTYKEANDASKGKLGTWIKQRKGLKKGTPEYNMLQNKINKAYGKGPTNRPTSPTKKTTVIEPPKEIKFDSPTPKPAAPKKPQAKKPAAPKKKTTTDAGGRDLAKVVSEEIKRDTPASKKKEPTRREKRKATKAAKKNKPVGMLRSDTKKVNKQVKQRKEADKALDSLANRPMRAGGAKPDYLDMDGDGNKKESMKSAIRSKKGMGGKKLYKSGGIKKAKKMYGGMKDRRKGGKK